MAWQTIASIGAGLTGNLFNWLGNKETNRTNKEIQKSTNEFNIQAVRETNLQNLNLQHEAWRREDDAVQRRMADLQSAGINPMLAAGNPAQASAPVKLDAPQAESVRMQRFLMETDLVERALRMRDDFATAAKTRDLLEANAREHNARADEIERSVEPRIQHLENQLIQQGEQITYMQLQQENLRLSNQYAPDVNRGVVLDNIEREIRNQYAEEIAKARLDDMQMRIVALELENMALSHDLEIYKNLGMPTSARGNEVNAAAFIAENVPGIMDAVRRAAGEFTEGVKEAGRNVRGFVQNLNPFRRR